MINMTNNMHCFFTRLMLPVLVVAFFTVACRETNNEKPVRGDLINEKSFTSILVDLYLADGLLSFPEVSNRYPAVDSLSRYRDIVQARGYSVDDVNKTLYYYFINNPRKLIAIHDKVLAYLSEMEALYKIELGKSLPADGNLWKDEQSFSFPGLPGKEDTGFSIEITPPGVFVLHFTVTVYPDDQSLYPCFNAWYRSTDSTSARKAIPGQGLKYIKDGYPHSYSLPVNIPRSSPVVLEGFLMDAANNPSGADMHARITDISLLRSLEIE